MADDYYSILGVARGASAEEIQKAYRRLARKHHPDLADDKEAAKQKFQQVQHAYDVLSDPKKRQLYDQYGNEFAQGRNPFQGGQMPNGMDLEQVFGRGQAGGGGFEEILKQVFGGAAGGGFGAGGRQSRQSAPVKGDDVEQKVTVPFSTAILGGKHQISLQRSNGKVDNITITIPAGIQDGKKIRLRGQGHASTNGGSRGDMLVKVSIAPHPCYQRIGENLLLNLPISVREAMLGAKIDLMTPHGEVSITVPPNSSSGKRLRLKGMGVRKADSSTDLLVELTIVVPDDLNESQKELLVAFTDSIQDHHPRQNIKW